MLDRNLAFMGSARDTHPLSPEHGAPMLHLLFPGDAHSVRAALGSAMAAFRALDFGDETRGAVEIVLAEVLNNVVEHAYDGHARGVIEIMVEEREGGLEFRVLDDGRPMPGGTAPAAFAHDLDVALEALPEGGFGWLMIRELTEWLSYRRIGNRNELCFRLSLAQLRRPN